MLKRKIQELVNESLKKGDNFTSQVLRFLLSSIHNKEKEKRYRVSKNQKNFSEEELIKEAELSDEEIIEVIFSEIKKRREAIELYQKGKREDLAEKEKKEIELLQKFLPPQLTEAELKNLIQESIKRVGASSIRDIGKVMADLTPKIKGRTEMSQISKITREILEK